MLSAKSKIQDLLSLGGIQVDGPHPWDIQVHNDSVYQRVLSEGSIGLGESYMDGWWDVEQLDELVARLKRAEVEKQAVSTGVVLLALKGKILNRQTPGRSSRVAREHYDLGNDLYEAMLDRHMQYTCAYWDGATSLDEAQVNKLHLVCRKLQLSPGMRVVELGGGFGGLAYFIAKHYGCEVTSYNISREQVEYGQSMCEGLPVRFELKDYREAASEPEPFDRVVSVGLCEHIGQKNYHSFFELAHRLQRAGGLFLVHTIGNNESYTCTDEWIDKYIFPGGLIPSIAQLGSAMEGCWVVEDLHNIGPDYDPTLMAWWSNFDRCWPQLALKYGDRFYRMWRFYLLSAAGAFRARKLQVWQFVLSKGDIARYTPVR